MICPKCKGVGAVGPKQETCLVCNGTGKVKSERSVKNLDMGQLELTWSMLMMGHQKPNIPALKENCDLLRQAMIQLTAGQRKNDKPHYVNFNEIGTICNNIVIEAMCLYLSGALDKLDDQEDEPGEKEETE